MLLGLLSLSAFAQVPDQNVGVTTQTPDLADVKIIQKLGDRVPLEAQFHDENGNQVTIKDSLRSRPTIVLPIFYRCKGVCNVELQGLVAALPQVSDLKVGKDFDVIVLGIDPNEGPDLAKAKLDSIITSSPTFQGTEKGWHFLTGSYDQIRKVTDALGFMYEYDPKTDFINHPAGTMFLTPNGIVSSYILGANYAPTDLRRNLDKAAEFKVGNRSADIFFGCVHVDPITGQRSLVVVQALKVAAVVTLIGLSTLVYFWSHKKAKNSADDQAWTTED